MKNHIVIHSPSESGKCLRQGLVGQDIKNRMRASFKAHLGKKQWIAKANPTAVRKVTCTLLRPTLDMRQQQVPSHAMSHSNEMAERVYSRSSSKMCQKLDSSLRTYGGR